MQTQAHKIIFPSAYTNLLLLKLFTRRVTQSKIYHFVYLEMNKWMNEWIRIKNRVLKTNTRQTSCSKVWWGAGCRLGAR